jgi:two-component system sensor histidine kinase CpxA
VPRLFWKIFLWFWVAQILIGLVMFQLAVALRPNDPRDLGRGVASGLTTQARALAFIYEREGPSGVQRELRRPSREFRGARWVFDEQGRWLAGSRTVPMAKELARRAAESGVVEVTPENQNNQPRLVARSMPLREGHSLVLVSEIRQSSGGRGFRFWPFSLRLDATRLAALLALSGLVCYALARYIASPAAKLRRATQQLASGDLSTRVGNQMGRRRDELADLGGDFDRMAERIEALMISERRLLGDISHELRSPLARLSLALDLAEGGADAETQGYFDRIRREAERLNELIGQLLSLSRLESGSAQIEQTPVQLTDLLHEVAHDADFEARGRARRVTVLQADECWTGGDADLLRSAVENVVRNAVRYTAESTSVQLSLVCDGKQATLSVRDFGPGVPEETLNNLFRPFYRVADARDRQSGGTGLGLAITQRAVKVHGGRVEAHNAEGGGLLVELHLPVNSKRDGNFEPTVAEPD